MTKNEDKVPRGVENEFNEFDFTIEWIRRPET